MAFLTLAESDGDSVHGGAGGGGGGGGGGGTPVKSAINQRLHDVKMPSSSSVHHAVPSSAVTASNLRYIQTTGARTCMYVLYMCVV